MTGTASTIDDDTTVTEPTRKKKWRGYLSKAFSLAVPYAATSSVAFAAKTCTMGFMCTAGAPPALAVATGLACAGLIGSTIRAAFRHRERKKTDETARFWSKDTAKTVALHTLFSVSLGGAFFAFADDIAHAASPLIEKAAPLWERIAPFLGRVANVFTGNLDAQLAAETAARQAAEAHAEAMRQSLIAQELEIQKLLEEKVATISEKLAAIKAELPPLEPGTPDMPPQATIPPTDFANDVTPEVPSDSAELPNADAPPAEDIANKNDLPVENNTAPEPEAQPEQGTAVNQTPETSPEPQTDTPPPEPAQPEDYFVRRGDNLSKIAAAHYDIPKGELGRYVDALATANDLTDGVAANHLAIGQKLILPAQEVMETHDATNLDWKALHRDVAGPQAAPSHAHHHTAPRVAHEPAAKSAFTRTAEIPAAGKVIVTPTGPDSYRVTAPAGTFGDLKVGEKVTLKF